ncbi:MAG: cupin domain-containing protein [Gaiellaceae bacterium]
MIEEARLEEGPFGRAPAGEGWFVVNVREAAWAKSDHFGAGCRFESASAAFPELGINLRVLEPGQPACLYHRESSQEDFLVLAGECLLLVEGRERRLSAWDFVHCPPDTEHVFVGAGESSCVILMVGARPPEGSVLYPVSELARSHGAGVERETDSPEEAYSSFEHRSPGRPASWDRLPWA